MRPLRLKVDKIDQKILRLLQQRTELARQIGETKRRHGSVIYVPERERALVARLLHQSEGTLPERAVRSIYREIISSSRVAQGQAPIGMLTANAETLKLPARWCLGGSDEFVSLKNWAALADGVSRGNLAAALLSGQDLSGILTSSSKRKDFVARFRVAEDFSTGRQSPGAWPERIFVVMPRCGTRVTEGDRLVILIECKSTVNAVKSLFHAMPARPLRSQQILLPGHLRSGLDALLVRLTLSQRTEGLQAASWLQAAAAKADLRVSLLGLYPGTETYGG